MRCKHIMLGATMFAAAAFATPALAQYADNPPQYSSPEAQAETRALNRDAADGTCAPPAVLNGEMPASEAARTPDRCQRYEARMERYSENRRAYDARMRAYRRDMTHYRAEMRHWNEEQAEY